LKASYYKAEESSNSEQRNEEGHAAEKDGLEKCYRRSPHETPHNNYAN
jgi:hypothetical protein